MKLTLLLCCACALLLPTSLWSDSRRAVAPAKGKAAPAPVEPAPPSRSGAGAVIEGRVKLPGLAEAPVKIQRYTVVSKGGTVAMSPSVAVVYLEGSFPAPAVPPKAQILQKDFTFIPALLPVRAGTVVAFPNEDDTYHNVFSYSKTKRFDLGRYLPSERPVPSQLFDKAGMVQLHCDIHEHMRAVILVLDTPYFTKTDAAGNFRLPGLPAGKYKLKAWLSSAQTEELPVDLPGPGVPPIKVQFP